MTDFDEAFRKEFEVDPSAAKPMDMLDVLEEASTSAQRSRIAALEMQAAVAIRAILDGADVMVVAQKCGFDLSTEGDDQPQTHPMVGEIYSWMMGENRSQDSMTEFISWLNNSLGTIIRQKLEREDHGGR